MLMQNVTTQGVDARAALLASIVDSFYDSTIAKSPGGISTNRNRSVIGASLDPLVTRDPEEKLTEVNAVFRARSNFTREGRTRFELYFPVSVK